MHRNLEKLFFLGGQKGGWQQCFLPLLTLCFIALFHLQGPATSAGRTTARAGAQRRPCWCAPGWPASRARSRSSTPTEPAPGCGCCQTPQGLADVFWITTMDKKFSSASSLEWAWGGTAGGPREGSQARLDKDRLSHPSPPMVCSTKA